MYLVTSLPATYNSCDMMEQNTSTFRIFLSPARLRQVFLLLIAICSLVGMLAACSIQPGGDLLMFVQDGRLYVVAPDGSGLRELSRGDIVSGAWSPDHHQIVFRAGKDAASLAAKLRPGDVRGAPDTISDLYMASVSGGTPLRITPDANAFARSDAWWNPNGDRLLYREEYAAPQTVPVYFVSQSDQPVGIARKSVEDIVSVPVLSADGSQVAGIDAKGNLLLGTPGQSGKIIAKGVLLALPGTNRPTHVLWQPNAQALLYPMAGSNGILLILQQLGGGTRAVAAFPSLLDVAFSPNGQRLLVRTPDDFQLWPSSGDGQAIWHVTEDDPLALPYWSPDGSKLLIQDSTGLKLVDIATGKITPLLAVHGSSPEIQPTTRWHPAAGSPWSPDGSQFVFASAGSSEWLGAALPTPRGAEGIYVATVSGKTPAEQPRLLASGDVSMPSWSYLDPSTVFLVTS